ncbi:MAG: hypothetical protein QM479_17240 [Pseudomonadota bacterium]
MKSFSNYLRNNLDGFNNLPEKMQFHFCQLSFSLSNKKYQHQKFKGYSFLPYQTIYSKFGRNFLSINEQLGFFDITTNWSKSKSYSRGVKLTEHVAVLKAEFLKSDPVLSELISENGKILRTLPTNGILKEVNLTNRKYTAIKSTIAVDHVEADKLLSYLLSMKHTNGLNVNVDYVVDSIRTIKHYSYTKIAGKNTLIQRYSYSDSGRLYAKNINLQNAPKIVRDAFLDGCYNHDFDNCHYSIFCQLAERVGYQCPAIKHYIAHKTEVREKLSIDIGISIKAVKTALLAIMYGSKATQWHEAAIPRLIGERAPALYEHQIFKGISEEIQIARKKIIEGWTNKTQRSFINHMNKPISKAEDDRFIMAHFQQGIESKMLHVAIDNFGDEIVLLQHDGFSTKSKIDTDIIINQIKREMNFDMAMATELHQVKLDNISALDGPILRLIKGINIDKISKNNTGQVLTYHLNDNILYKQSLEPSISIC